MWVLNKYIQKIVPIYYNLKYQGYQDNPRLTFNLIKRRVKVLFTNKCFCDIITLYEKKLNKKEVL